MRYFLAMEDRDMTNIPNFSILMEQLDNKELNV